MLTDERIRKIAERFDTTWQQCDFARAIESELQAQASKPVFIIFDGPPDNEAPHFVEVETADGRSVSVESWHEYPRDIAMAENLWRLGPFYTTPQPTPPCPRCAELRCVISDRTDECKELQAKCAELEKELGEVKVKMHETADSYVKFMLIDHPKALAERDTKLTAAEHTIRALQEEIDSASERIASDKLLLDEAEKVMEYYTLTGGYTLALKALQAKLKNRKGGGV